MCVIGPLSMSKLDVSDIRDFALHMLRESGVNETCGFSCQTRECLYLTIDVNFTNRYLIIFMGESVKS